MEEEGREGACVSMAMASRNRVPERVDAWGGHKSHPLLRSTVDFFRIPGVTPP